MAARRVPRKLKLSFAPIGAYPSQTPTTKPIVSPHATRWLGTTRSRARGCAANSIAAPVELEGLPVASDETIRGALLKQLALISASARSEVARVAAIKARIATRSRKLELLQVAGVLDGALD